MENYLDELISQARLDIEHAQKRLEMLNALKDSMLENEATVSVSKASQLIGISEQSIRLWLKLGKIKRRDLRKTCSIDMDSIKDVLKGNLPLLRQIVSHGGMSQASLLKTKKERKNE